MGSAWARRARAVSPPGMFPALLLVVLGCAARPVPPAAPPATAAPAPPDPAAGVESPALAALLREHWDLVLAGDPVFATRLGDHRFDEALPDLGAPAWEARLAALGRLEDALRALALGPTDALHRDLLVWHIAAERATAPCAGPLWMVGPRDNPLVLFGDLPEVHTGTEASLRARYRALPGVVDGHIAALRLGLATGRVANAETVQRVIAQADTLLAQPRAEWSLHRPGFSAELDGIEAAFRRYRAFLVDELLPRARTAPVGLTGLPEGAACYAALARQSTTTALSPDALHEAGLSALRGIHAEMAAIGQRLYGATTPAALRARLDADPSARFASADEVLRVADAHLRAAEAAVPRVFGRLPAARCEVRPIPPAEAPWTTIAYYRPPGAERLGVYFVNTHAAESRPRFEAAALAFHESVPGHHFQIALQQEQPALPAFRRHLGVTAYVEGWALYTERLADELGLYPSDLDRLGMLSFDAWRASRLVVDTGLHARGWSRAQAEAFMHENTLLAPENITNEVDRYIAWPGQALGYKVGQLEIRRMRAEAEARLGPAFSLAAFHDAVLVDGPLPLPLLDARLRSALHP